MTYVDPTLMPINWRPPSALQSMVDAALNPTPTQARYTLPEPWMPEAVNPATPTVSLANGAGAAGLAEEAAGAGGGGWLGAAKGAFASAGGMQGALRRSIPGAIAYLAAPALGSAARQLGAPHEAVNALQGATQGAALGGTVFGAPGAVFGGLGGALLSGFNEMSHSASPKDIVAGVEDYRAALHRLPKDLRDDAHKMAVQIGHADIADDQKLAMLAKLTKQMGKATKQKAAVDTQTSGMQAQTQQQMQLQMQMAQAMNEVGQRSVAQGDAMAEAVRRQIPNVAPQMQPILELDADQRAAYGRQVANAYQAATWAQPMVNQMDAQLAYLAQLNQQRAMQVAALRATRASGTQSLSQAVAAAAGTGK